MGLPVYFAVGNHDMENRTLFESRYDSTYYHFVHENDLFIVLDPNIDGWNISGDQLNFLKQTLASNAGRDESINFWSEVEPLFSALDNEIVLFAGDLGASWSSDVSYDKYDNITLISSGMGDENGGNFIVVNIHNDYSIHYDLICLSDTGLNCMGDLTDYQVVGEISNYNRSFIYPNPMNNQFTVSLIGFDNPDLFLFDLQGKLVLKKELSNATEETIMANNIPKGFYLAKIIDEQHQLVIKVIKK